MFDLPVDARSFDELNLLGVGWVRVQFRMGERSLSMLTSITEQLFRDGIGVWLTLHYRNPDNIADQESFVASPRGSYPPVDEAQYTQEVVEVISAIIEQIESAGLDPTSKLIVQFSNEVIPTDLVPDSPNRYFHGSGDDYLGMLSLTYDAIKSAGSGIPVAPGGISSQSMEVILEYEADTVSAGADLKLIRDWNDRMLREGRFDYMDVHIRNEIETIDDKIAWIRDRWTGPIGVTEVGGLCDSGCSDEDVAAYTDDVQAVDLPVRMRTLLDAGAERLFWASLVESPDLEPQYEKEGLIREDWTHKPAYDAYKDLIVEFTGP